MIRVDAPDDPRLRDFTELTDVALRRVREPAEGLFMAESLPVIERALAAGYRPRSVLTEERWLSAVRDLLAAHDSPAPVWLATPEVVAATTGFRLHRGPMAAMARRELPPPAAVVGGAGLVVVLADLVDHTNVGAAFRSAAALGVDALLVTPQCADPLYRRSVRVSMGAVFALPWTRTSDWEHDLADFRTVALTPDPAADDVSAVAGDRPIALIVGTEGPGLAAGVLARAQVRARIPMAPGVDSLNVAAAVAVAVYAVRSAITTAPRATVPPGDPTG